MKQPSDRALYHRFFSQNFDTQEQRSKREVHDASIAKTATRVLCASQVVGQMGAQSASIGTAVIRSPTATDAGPVCKT